jgi:hypothetical protein
MKLLLSSAPLILLLLSHPVDSSNNSGDRPTKKVGWRLTSEQSDTEHKGQAVFKRPPTPYRQDGDSLYPDDLDSISSYLDNYEPQIMDQPRDSSVTVEDDKPKSILRNNSIHTMTISKLCWELQSRSTSASEIDSVIAVLLEKDCVNHQAEIRKAVYQRIEMSGMRWDANSASWRQLYENCLLDERVDSQFSQIIYNYPFVNQLANH